jgi:hypothetical protein
MNMKKIMLFVWLSGWLCNVHAQDFPIDPDTKQISYNEVVTVAGADKNTLYLRAKAWAAPLTKVEDNKEAAKYIGKGQIKVKYPAPMRGFFHEGLINYKASISCKDGKYKYEVTEITHTSPSGNGGKLDKVIPECGKYTLTLDGWGTIKREAKLQIPKIIEGLKASMEGAKPESEGQSSKSKDDW